MFLNFKKINIFIIFFLIVSWIVIYFFVKKINFQTPANRKFQQKIKILAPEEITNVVVKYAENLNFKNEANITIDFFSNDEEVFENYKKFNIFIYNEDFEGLYIDKIELKNPEFFCKSNYNVFSNSVIEKFNQNSELKELFENYEHIYLLNIDENEFLKNILKNDTDFLKYLKESNKISIIQSKEKINQYGFLNYLIITNEDKTIDKFGFLVKKIEVKFKKIII